MTTDPVDVPLSEATKHYGLANRVAKRCGVSRQFVSLVVRGSCSSPEVEGCLREEIVACRAKEEEVRCQHVEAMKSVALRAAGVAPDRVDPMAAWNEVMREIDARAKWRDPTAVEAAAPGCPSSIRVGSRWDLSADLVPRWHPLKLRLAAVSLILVALCGLRDLSAAVLQWMVYRIYVRHGDALYRVEQAGRALMEARSE